MTESTKQAVIRSFGWILPPNHRYTWSEFADEIEKQCGELAIPKSVAEMLRSQPITERFTTANMFKNL